MNISEIDSNFKIETNLPEKDIVWQDARGDNFVKYGVVKADEDYLRMPRETARAVSTGVEQLCDNTAGVRIRFCTDSPYIAIKAVFPMLCRFPHMPLSGSSGFDLYQEAGGQQSFVGAYIPPLDAENGFAGIVYTNNPSGRNVNYILNFPSYNPVAKLYIGIKEGSRTQAPDNYINQKPVVFYGSSITQGGCASRPGNIYQNFLSRALNMDYLCLGFSGSAKAEKIMAEYMAGLQMCAFVIEFNREYTVCEKTTEFTVFKFYKFGFVSYTRSE